MEPTYNLFSRFLALKNMHNDSIRERFLRRRNYLTTLLPSQIFSERKLMKMSGQGKHPNRCCLTSWLARGPGAY